MIKNVDGRLRLTATGVLDKNQEQIDYALNIITDAELRVLDERIALCMATFALFANKDTSLSAIKKLARRHQLHMPSFDFDDKPEWSMAGRLLTAVIEEMRRACMRSEVAIDGRCLKAAAMAITEPYLEFYGWNT